MMNSQTPLIIISPGNHREQNESHAAISLSYFRNFTGGVSKFFGRNLLEIKNNSSESLEAEVADFYLSLGDRVSAAPRFTTRHVSGWLRNKVELRPRGKQRQSFVTQRDCLAGGSQ